MLWFNVPKILFGLLKKFYRASQKICSQISGKLKSNCCTTKYLIVNIFMRLNRNMNERGHKRVEINERKKQERPSIPLVARVPINKTMFMSTYKNIYKKMVVGIYEHSHWLAAYRMRQNPVRRLISQIIWIAIHRCRRHRHRLSACPVHNIHAMALQIKTDCSFFAVIYPETDFVLSLLAFCVLYAHKHNTFTATAVISSKTRNVLLAND